MDQDKVLYAIENRCLYLKMTGAIRHLHCASLDTLLREVTEQDQVDTFVVDLRQATYLDSTSLGMIARMARYMKKKSDDKLVLISINEDINQILNSVQFGSVANIVEKWKNLPEQFFESELFAKPIKSSREMIIQSHKELAQINEDNRKKFTAVIESLEKKYKQKNK
jgi:anti-anti-sigma factor